MRITVLVARYAITGVPLAQVRLARALASQGHEVNLVIGYVGTTFSAPVIPGVNVDVWHRPSVRQMFLPLITYFWNEKPEVVFSAEDHLNVMVLLAATFSGSNAKVSGSCRVTPFDTYSNRPLTKRWWLKQLSKVLMWRANALTCVSNDMVDQYRQVFHSPPHVCVYNIVKDQAAFTRMEEKLDHPWAKDAEVPLLIAAGTLAPWKGFSDLLMAMKSLSTRRRVRLLVLGDGPQREQLQSLARELELENSVQFVGFVDNPLKFYMRAKVFVLSSLVEGMPNVLVEAMMCGCTPVSTDCPTGPRELLKDGKYGYLVPVGDPEAMATAILHALDKPISRAKLDEAIAPFDEKVVLRRHFEVLGL